MKIAFLGLAALLTFCGGKTPNQDSDPNPLPSNPVSLSGISVGADQVGVLVATRTQGQSGPNGYLVIVGVSGVPYVQSGEIDGSFALVDLHLVHNPFAKITWRPSKTLPPSAQLDANFVRTLSADLDAAKPFSSLGTPCNAVDNIGTVHSPLSDMSRQPEPPTIIVYRNGDHSNPLGCDPRAKAIVGDVSRLLTMLGISQ